MTRLTVLFGTLLLAAFAACGRSGLDLTDSGQGGASGCTTNTDCPSPSAPNCELPQGICVGCLTSPDTCPASETCDPTTHQCKTGPSGCMSNADCAAPTPVCRTDVHTCVVCTQSSDCASDQTCSNFQCVGFCGNGQACDQGFACCSPLCVNEAVDPANCGACGNNCGPYPEATAACTSSTCAIQSCNFGFSDCDGIVTDGCEIDTTIDVANCGTCGNTCATGETCSGGVCVGGCGENGTCALGQACCGASCENTQSDPDNCGGCGTVCVQVPQATIACEGSACAIAACSVGFGDCNGIETDGCEAVLGTDITNCGSCGNACPPGDTCSGGICTAGCGLTGTCQNGLTCCNGSTCDSLTNDLKNCGGCNFVCSAVANGTPACTGSACHIGTCNTGFADCDGQVADGCEVSTSSDPNNCGGCGHACGANSVCTNGVCTTTTTCNGGPTCSPTQQCCMTGCTDTTKDPGNCGGCGNSCTLSQGCNAGKCTNICNGVLVCLDTQTCCMTGCSDTTSDPLNCGGCNNPCAPGEACVASTCQSNCLGGPACSGAQQCCMTGCSDTTSDPKNCGNCGNACPAGGVCMGGMCQATCNGAPACTGKDQCCTTGCTDVTTDVKNCGACGTDCPAGDTCVGGMCTSTTACNGGPACTGGKTCCTSGCVDTTSDENNCGKCGIECGATASCSDSACIVDSGAFNPTVNPTYLSPGTHNFTTINIPAGITVYVAGPGAQSGTLDLHATGAIVINGTIDLSGGPGTQNTITSMSTNQGRAGGGGFTGQPYQSAASSAACEFIAGNPGSLGFATQGSPGSCTVLSTTTCITENDPTSLLFTAPVATFGGGAGIFTGYRAYGSGGGGIAGGAPGALGAAYPGESDCSGISGGGGAVTGHGGSAKGAPYDGLAGASGQTQCPGLMPPVPPAYVGGGGGGSIGPASAADLAVLMTFQPGSGGGGGSADYLNRPVFGGTSGGGGGGGALKLSTPATITIQGQVLANGGPGGDAFIGNGKNANCDPQPGAAGGGGSGGVIYLSAPSITVGGGATISAVGGPGGVGSEFASGGAGGKGGLGRIRVSATSGTCTLGGSFNPPIAGGCAPSSKAGFTYVGSYPN